MLLYHSADVAQIFDIINISVMFDVMVPDFTA